MTNYNSVDNISYMAVDKAIRIVRGYARNEKDEKRLVAAGLTKSSIYREDRGETLGKFRMRRGELLGVVNGLLAFGSARSAMIGAVKQMKEWGAAIIDAETGLRSDTDGAEMLDLGLTRFQGERSMVGSKQAAKMQAKSVESRTKGRMSAHEAELIWRNEVLKTHEALALMTKWTQASAYRVFGPRGVIAGRKGKGHKRRATIKRQKASGKGAIYFVRANGRGAVKIGYATDVEARVRALQTSHHSPLKLLAFISGTQKDEAELHKRFAAYRINGEWFKVTGALKKYIETLPKLPED
ncbi:MAG: GIY-YIG nuclease family protein [Patescibacteria group bacterium]|nr:GIY-YIG nuclease family protein [Patescibacteria group bacterium]